MTHATKTDPSHIQTLRGYYEQRLEELGLVPRSSSRPRSSADFFVHHAVREGAGHCHLDKVGDRFQVQHLPREGEGLTSEVGRFDTFEEAARCCKLVLDAELAAVRLRGELEPQARHPMNPHQPCEDCGGSGHLPLGGSCGRCGGLGAEP